MEELYRRQKDIIVNLTNIKSNFKKDSASRKTSDYIAKKLKIIDDLWAEFEKHHLQLAGVQSEIATRYFAENIYEICGDLYKLLREQLSTYGESALNDGQAAASQPDRRSGEGKQPGISAEKATQPDGKLEELLSLQRTQFRALRRTIRNIDDELTDQWEIEEELVDLKRRWNAIEELHIEIDNILIGGDLTYLGDYEYHEKQFKNIKRELKRRLSEDINSKKATPPLDIPTFTGVYAKWPTFHDLFNEAIHMNKNISKAQKLQHLKGKLRGEPERLIQHLNITASNYEVAWQILLRRYDNRQKLFAQCIETFLNQSKVTKQSADELRKLYDVSTECIHAIHNLGIDTNGWDPLLVHLLCKKLDQKTYSDYKETRKEPRELASLDEFMDFLEGKFMAIEPIGDEKETKTTFQPASSTSQNTNKVTKTPFRYPSNYNKPYGRFNKNYQVLATNIAHCPLCNMEHNIFKCDKFLNMTPKSRYETVLTLRLCKNCLYNHFDKPCRSTKRCRTCDGEHNTMLHDHAITVETSTSSLTQNEKRFKKSNKKNVYHVASDIKETLLPTAVIYLKAADGTYIKTRALLDQSSQVSIISENLVQFLGLKRQKSRLSESPISGIDLCQKKCKGIVSIEIKSIYQDYKYITDAFVVVKVAYDLPSSSFSTESMQHLEGLTLADPKYNISQKVNLLLGGDVYSDIILDGLIKGPSITPIAQETKFGYIISGSVNPLPYSSNDDKFINNLPASEDLSKFWEVEDIATSSSTLTESEQYVEDFYSTTTRRLEDGKYVVALPMKPGYEKELGLSRNKAIAQFRQLEKRFERDPSLAQNYKQFMSEYEKLNHMWTSLSGKDPSHTD